MTSTVVYQGDLHTEAVHLKSKTHIETDAPTDNNGKGERFSPTDLVATAFASCMLTLIGIASKTHNFNIDGTLCSVTKIMATNPRRIGEIIVSIEFPKEQHYDDKTKAIIERAALTCPVYESLHPEVKKSVSFLWP